MTRSKRLGGGRRMRGSAARVATTAAVVAATVVLAVSGCTRTGAGAAGSSTDRPLVVVTTNILGDVVGEIVGDEADVMVLMRPGADPHSFEISASEAARILSADLIVSNGLGLEEGLQQHVEAAEAEGVPVVAAGEFIEPLEYSAGDAEGAVDPHFWTDPTRMIAVAGGVAEAVTTSIPEIDASSIERSTAAYTAELEAVDSEMRAAFEGIPEADRQLVTNHHVFGYLADHFGFTLVGAVVPSGTTLAAPSASDLADLVDAIDEAGVTAIFADSSQPDRLAQVLADEAGVDVDVIDLFTESLSEPGGGADTYLQMMRTNTERITTGLSP